MIMEKLMKRGIALLAILMVASTAVQAQGFLKRLAQKAGVVKADTTATDSTATADNDSVKALKWDQIPKYEIKKVVLTNADGTPKLNEDGTPMEAYKLVDQFGNIRSAEAVKAQQKKINKAVGRILLKVGAGAAVGVAGGLLLGKGKAAGGIIGGVAGAAAGLALSAKDIKQAKALKKSMKEQEKLLEKYEQTFTAEGKPIDADASTMKEVESLAKGEVTMTAEAYKEVLDSPAYQGTDNWEPPTI